MSAQGPTLKFFPKGQILQTNPSSMSAHWTSDILSTELHDHKPTCRSQNDTINRLVLVALIITGYPKGCPSSIIFCDFLDYG